MNEIDRFVEARTAAALNAWATRRADPNSKYNRNVAARIATLLNGKAWNADTLATIAAMLRAAGYTVRDRKEP